MIAESEHDESPLAPLFACLAGEIHHAAAMMAAGYPDGHLDPPLVMSLDEVTQICPVPVPTWLATPAARASRSSPSPTAKRSSQPVEARRRPHRSRHRRRAGVPARRHRPGHAGHGRQAVRAACLREHGTEHVSRHDVMTAAMIRQLPPGRALVLRGSLAPVIARLPMAWRDRLYKSALRSGTAVAKLTAAPASLALDDVVTPEPLAPLPVQGGRVHARRVRAPARNRRGRA